MNNDKLADFIKEKFDSDALELALYLISRYEIRVAAEASISNGAVQMPSIAPHSVVLMSNYELGITDNKYYIQFYKEIRAMQLMDDISIHTMAMHLALADAKNRHRSKLVVRDLVTRRYEILTYIMFLQEGAESAKSFNFQLKELVTLTDKEQKFFSASGL